MDGYLSAGARTIGLYYDPPYPDPPEIPPIPTFLTGNTIDIESVGRGAWAYGFYLYAQDFLFADISNNKLSIKGGGTAFGAYIITDNGLIGNSSTPTRFIGNAGIEDGADGVIDGSNSRYLMYLDTGQGGGGNRVECYNNHIAPYQNGVPTTWSGGNYPDKTGDPYYHAIRRRGFILSPYSSDKIYP